MEIVDIFFLAIYSNNPGTHLAVFSVIVLLSRFVQIYRGKYYGIIRATMYGYAATVLIKTTTYENDDYFRIFVYLVNIAASVFFIITAYLDILVYDFLLIDGSTIVRCINAVVNNRNVHLELPGGVLLHILSNGNPPINIENFAPVRFARLGNVQPFRYGDECSICQTVIDTTRPHRVLPCHHAFDSECIDPWIQNNHFCPLCKANIME